MSLRDALAAAGPEGCTAAMIALVLLCWAATWLDPHAMHLVQAAIH